MRSEWAEALSRQITLQLLEQLRKILHF